MKRINDTIIIENSPSIISYAAVGGKKESEGPLAKSFDVLLSDTRCNQKTWEKAESCMAKQCLQTALQKANLSGSQLSAVVAGDLQAQCTATHYAMRGLNIPLIGLYGACSTMAEAVALSACMVSANGWEYAAAMSSSHFCAAERQFRTPLDYGAQRNGTAQWTVTAAGTAILANKSKPPYVTKVTFGRVQDLSVKDINNMGAAMAPAAAQTILSHLTNTKTAPQDYDVIYTGDLGFVGSELLKQLLKSEGVNLTNHQDCGLIIYDSAGQQVESGASGAGCSASVLCCHVLPKIANGQLNRVLFLSTGALMSQTTFLQGETIPSIAHLIEIIG